MNISYINDPESISVILYVLAFGLVSWFMGWGVSFLTSLFIKIFEKGV